MLETAPNLLDVEAARVRLGGIGLSTMRLLLRRGDLPAVRIGRRVLVAEADVTRYIEARRADAARAQGTPA